MYRLPFAAALICVTCVAAALGAQEKQEESALERAQAAHAAARRELAEATAALSRSQIARTRTERSIEVELGNKPDLVEARRLAAELARHYDRLREAVKKDLEEDEDYLALVAAVWEAERALAAANADESATLTHRVALIHDLMSARARLTRFEAALFALDPEIEDTRLALNRAHEHATRLERHYRAQRADDARLRTAEEEIAHARTRLGKARESLAQAASELRAAEERESLRKAGRRADRPPIRPQEP